MNRHSVAIVTLSLCALATVSKSSAESTMEEIQWQLVQYLDEAGEMIAVLADTTVDIRFSDGELGGSAGCNQFNAPYESKGDQITIGPAVATRRFCAGPEGIMDQEQQFFATLERSRSFTLTPGRLEPRDEDSSLHVSFRTAEP